jgi:carbamoyl-phosphate synthase large subunit
LRSLEHGRWGLNCDPAEAALDDLDDDELVRRAAVATPDRPFQLEAALRRGITVERLYSATRVDPWFLDQIAMITEARAWLVDVDVDDLTRGDWRRVKRLGFSDAQLGWLWRVGEDDVRARRLELGVGATFKTVDTCGAEFDAATPYHYSTRTRCGGAIGPRSSSSARAPTASDRGSSSTTAACTRPSHCTTPASRR